jgi:uncharacterized protein YjiS (DUF1127 family)
MSSILETVTHCRSQTAPGRSFGGRLSHLIERGSLAYRIWRERRALLGLSDAMLKDIGLSRADIYREATRSFWDLPDQR